MLTRYYLEDMQYLEGTLRNESMGYESNTLKEYGALYLWDDVWTLTII